MQTYSNSKKEFYFSELKKDFLELINKTVFQRYSHLLLKTVAIIEKNSMKFSGLPR
jgi:hypothetical protein